MEDKSGEMWLRRVGIQRCEERGGMAMQKSGWDLPKSGGHCLLGTHGNMIPTIRKKLRRAYTFSQVGKLLFISSPFMFTWLLTMQEHFIHVPSRPG